MQGSGFDKRQFKIQQFTKILAIDDDLERRINGIQNKSKLKKEQKVKTQSQKTSKRNISPQKNHLLRKSPKPKTKTKSKTRHTSPKREPPLKKSKDNFKKPS